MNPADPEKVVAVMQDSTFSLSENFSNGDLASLEIEGEALDAYSPRQLKGAFYLTKIAHMLLPQNIPEIHQAGEARDGQQTIDRERVAHTAGHARFQEQRAAGKATYGAESKMFNEMNVQKSALESELKRIGLDRGFGSPYSNYSKDTPRQTSYLPEFRPWGYTYNKLGEIQLAFDEEAMRVAIAELSDIEARTRCETFLERVLTLFAEEQEDHAQNPPEESQSEYLIGKLELEFLIVDGFIDEGKLFSIETEEEAVKSEHRELVRTYSLPRILKMQGALKGIKIPPERSLELEEKYRQAAQAVGAVRNGIVDHTR